MMLVLAAAWLIAGFENVGTVEFRRVIDLRWEFGFMAAKRMVSFLLTIALALLFRSYWARVIGMLLGRFAGVILSYVLHPYRPRFSLAASRDLFSFSGWLLPNNLLGVGILRAPHFFFGRWSGPQALGLYTVASALAYLPATELIAPVNRALFPGFAKFIDDGAKFRPTFMDVIAVIVMVVVPVSIGIAVVAEPLLRVLLGPQWMDAVPVIQLLAPAGAIVALTSNNVSAYVALGRTALAPLIMAVRIGVLIAALVWLAPPGRHPRRRPSGVGGGARESRRQPSDAATDVTSVGRRLSVHGLVACRGRSREGHRGAPANDRHGSGVHVRRRTDAPRHGGCLRSRGLLFLRLVALAT